MNGNKKRLGLAIVALLLIAALGAYAYYDRHARYFEDTDDARIESDQVAISSKLAGYVAGVEVEENEAVEKGALLVKIDPVDYRTRLVSAEADLAAARAAEGAASAGEAESRAAVMQAKAALQAAEAGLALAEREAKRFEPLVEAGAEPKTRLSQLVAERDRASAEVAAQRAALDRAEKRVSSQAAQTRSARAQRDVADARRQAAANDFDATTIEAPVGGKVASKTVRVGQFVQPGQRLMTVVPTQDIYVVANFKETQVGLMRAGQPAIIHVDALPGVEFRGEVISVTPGTGANFSLIKPENATGNFTKIVQRVPVRIRIDAGPAARKVLVPGLSLVAEVDTRASRDEIDMIRDEQERGAK